MARVTSLGNGPMDSVQVGKAVFVKEVTTNIETISTDHHRKIRIMNSNKRHFSSIYRIWR